MDRFARHLVLDGWGREAQERIRKASALVVGLGGLGSPAARYLAAAGVGHLTLVDFGRVDAPDLQRQILYGEADVGTPKAQAAAAHLRVVHSDVHVEGVARPFSPAMVAGHDVVLDGTDEPGTRALVHKTCVEGGVPLVWAALEGWEGQLATVLPGGACLDCVFPDDRQAPACSDIGVFGPLAGALGAHMAGEALKVLARLPAASRLLLLDMLHSSVESVELRRSPTCPTCSGAAK